jgi:glutaredoxin 3
MNKIVVYSTKICPYCHMAKALLKNYFNITDITEIFIDDNPHLKQEMISKTNRTTVPQIFIGDVHVGGFDDLNKLNQDNKLAKLLGIE